MSPHPLESLRYVARSWEIGDEPPVQEMAAILAELAEESPSTLLQACRRLIEYFPASGPVWWLSARALSAPDPVEEIWEAADELAQDPTPRRLAEALPAGALVAVPRPAGALAAALRRRPEVVIVGKPARAGIVVMRALAAAPGRLLVTSHLAALAAKPGAAEIWVVVERGVLLPEQLWAQLLARTPASRASALRAEDVAACVTTEGKVAPAEALGQPTCPPVAELLGWKS